jgi:hypothetical protein
MTDVVEIVNRPTIPDLANSVLPLTHGHRVADDPTLNAALVGEAIRVGLFLLFNDTNPGSPVHPLRLRAWVRHKLESVIPDILQEDEGGFRHVLLEGRGANLEFLGDALVLQNGYLCPAPTRAVEVGRDDYLLVSGVPTDAFSALKERISQTGLGRRLRGVSRTEIAGLGIPIQTLAGYLGLPDGIPSPTALLMRYLSLSQTPWSAGPLWQAYLGPQEGSLERPDAPYGFISWASLGSPRTRRPETCTVADTVLSLWREPVTERFFRHWIRLQRKDSDAGCLIPNSEWKQACLAIDALSSHPRRATIVSSGQKPDLLLMLGFPPFEAFARCLHAYGARPVARRYDAVHWEIPRDAKDRIRGELERAGVKVRTLGE